MENIIDSLRIFVRLGIDLEDIVLSHSDVKAAKKSEAVSKIIDASDLSSTEKIDKILYLQSF